MLRGSTCRRALGPSALLGAGGLRDALVYYRTLERHGDVVEGTFSGGVFSSDLVMVKHSNEYTPPTVTP